MGMGLAYIACRAGAVEDSTRGGGADVEAAGQRLRQTASEKMDAADWELNEAAAVANSKAAPARPSLPSP